MAGPGVTVVIRKNLFPRCIANMPRISHDCVGELMDYAVEVEQRYVPIETGSLYDSIHEIWTGNASGMVHAGGGTRKGTGEPIDYTGFQEWGTIYNAPHPFVRPAADAAAGKLNNLDATSNMETRLIS